MKRRLMALAKATLSVVLVATILYPLDGAAIVAAMHQLAPAALAAAALLVALQGIILGWRWHRIVAMLSGRRALRDAVTWVFIGIFFNNALPTSVGGDAVRIWLLRKSGVTFGVSLGSVTIERGTGVVVLGLIVSACVPAVWESLHHSPALRLTLVSIGPILLAGLVIAALVDKVLAAVLPNKLADVLRWLGEGLRRLAASPQALAEVSLLGIAASLAGLLAAYVLGESLTLGYPFPVYVVLVGGSVLMGVLPISLGGWGVRELSMVTLFGAVGGKAEQALALSLLCGLLPVLVSLPAGLFWWRVRGKEAAGSSENATDASAVLSQRDPRQPG
jgi:uncharacterized protein (TIRG00374 family)